MSLPLEESEYSQPDETDQEPRDNLVLTCLAWVVISAAVIGMVVMSQLRSGERVQAREMNRGDLVMQELMGRYILGGRELLRMTGQPGNEIEALISSFPVQGVPDQLCLSALEGEIKGPDAALSRLNSIEATTETESRVRNLLVALYEAYVEKNFEPKAVTQEDRIFLREKLGWFGELALNPFQPFPGREQLAAGAGGAAALQVAPPDTNARDEVLRLATQTLFALFSGLLSIGFFAFVGFILLIVLIVQRNKGNLQAGLGEPISYGGIYVETFALWIIVFPGLSVLYPLLLQSMNLRIDLLESAGLAFITSLVVMGWPVLRGVSWQRVREDIGWTSGHRPAVEPLYGFVTYIFAAPLMIVGLIFFAIFNSMAGGFGMLAANDMPDHPIIEYVIRDDPWSRFKLVFLACVLAPVVEETMFRGFLYRHLREATRGFGSGWSFIASGMMASFIFAVIHPQGLLFVPVLMGIALGLTIGREWRGTLLPSMVAHAINNGIVLAIVTRALGS